MKILSSFLFLSLFMVSCKSVQNPTSPTITNDASIEKVAPAPQVNFKKADMAEVAAQHYRLFSDFNTLNIKSEVSYDDGSLNQTINADIQIEKGKQILISARVLFFTAKVYLTPDRASFYETFNKTSYDGDFAFISQFLGADVSYENVENLLLGKAFYNLNEQPYQKGKNNELELKLNTFIMQLVLGTQFQVASTTIKQNNSTNQLVIAYPSYQSSDNVYLPKEIKIEAMQKKDIKIDLDYKKIYLNTPLDFRYKVPQGYKSIKI